MQPAKTETIKLSSKGQIVIPKAIREQLHWDAGMELTVIPTGDSIMLQPKPKKGKHRLEDLIGCLQHDGPPIPDEVLFAPVDYSADWEESEKRSR